MGGEGMGVVLASGGGLLANRLRGKRVAVAGAPAGLWQTKVVVDVRRVVPLPNDVPDEVGAMFFVNPLTAVAMVEHVLAVPRGAWLLQTAAGSALARLVRELGRRRGFRTIDVVRSEAGRERLRASGVEHVLIADADLPGAVARLTGDRGADAALDCVGGETAVLALRSLGRYGRMVCFGTIGRAPAHIEMRTLMMRGGVIEGFFLPAWIDRQSPITLLRALRRVKELLRTESARTPIRAIYPLDRVREALADAEPAPSCACSGRKFACDRRDCRLP
jgi:NADPH:quinone reductase-like Zn-dependent oxidoreductase